jgi:type I restriction enzyme S subunit
MQHLPFSELADLNPPVDTSSLAPETPVTFLGMADVSEDGDILQRQRRQYREVKYGYTAFREDDVLVAKITPCLENGKGCHATDLKNGVGFGSTEFHVLRAKSGVSPRYLYYWTQFADFRHAAGASMIGSAGQQRVQPYLYDEFELPAFDLNEQHRIARVLDAVDAAIRHTDRVVGKLDHVRQGLLHDLLTRGLTPDGRLRDPDAHPEQFRDSPLGRIPEEWEVTRMREVVPDAEYGISSSLDDETGIPVLRMNNLKGGEADTSSLKYSDSPVAKSKLLEPLDVLFNRTNSIEHVGRTGIWRSQLPKASFASYLVRLNPDEDRLHPEYLNYWLNLPQTQVNIRRFATHGVSQANINPTNLRKSYIALPDLDEQERIIHRVRTLERRSKKERDRQSKLQNLKRGLMRDLLTGAVRITDDVERRVADAIGQPVS